MAPPTRQAIAMTARTWGGCRTTANSANVLTIKPSTTPGVIHCDPFTDVSVSIANDLSIKAHSNVMAIASSGARCGCTDNEINSPTATVNNAATIACVAM